MRTSTVVSLCILLTSIVVGGIALAYFSSLVPWILLVAPVLIVAAALPFMVRGYVLTDDELLVQRLGWVTRLPLAGLVSVAADNEVMSRSIRLLGNGGLFSFTGEFWSRSLGRYRALATDPSRAVILRYPKRRIVITPDDPQRFIVRARTQLKNRA